MGHLGDVRCAAAGLFGWPAGRAEAPGGVLLEKSQNQTVRSLARRAPLWQANRGRRIYWPSVHPATVPGWCVRDFMDVGWDLVVSLSNLWGEGFSRHLEASGSLGGRSVPSWTLVAISWLAFREPVGGSLGNSWVGPPGGLLGPLGGLLEASWDLVCKPMNGRGSVRPLAERCSSSENERRNGNPVV